MSSRTLAFSTAELSSGRTKTTTRLHQNHVDLRYNEFSPVGEGGDDDASPANEPVILLHGLLGNRRNFASVASSLAAQLSKPRQIIAVDLRNHGENSHDFRDSMTYSDMARDVLAVVDRVAGTSGRAVLVGHSMGGKVAQALALMHPDRVAGLVVLDIAPVRYCPEGDASWRTVSGIVGSLAALDLEREDLRTKRDVDVALRGVLEDPALRAFVLTNLEQPRGGGEDAQLGWKINLKAIAEQIETIAGFDAHDRDMDVVIDEGTGVNGLSDAEGNMGETQYNGDVFFIHGGASRFVRHTHMKTIASFFPNHMLTTIRGAGHWVHAEAPDDTVALLKKYLDR